MRLPGAAYFVLFFISLGLAMFVRALYDGLRK